MNKDWGVVKKEMEAEVVQADSPRAQYLLEERLIQELDSQLALLPTVVKLWEDFEDLYSILSNESPPQNAILLKGQTMGSTFLKHQRRGSPKEICNSLHACNGIPCPKHYTPIRKFETIFMSRC
ncbi:hypothetical protein EMCRGX_G030147 [Ephydatia muelleri]